MGGFGSGRFGARSNRRFDSSCVRIGISDLARAGVFSSLKSSSARDAIMEVELNGRERTALTARLSVATDTGTAPWSVPRERGAVPPALWISEDSLFVRLVTTEQYFGGVRQWFRCPRAACGRRCAVLYRPHDSNARAFACRLCCAVRYTTQRIAEGYRLERRADRILDRLLATDGMIARPKGMHRSTFQRLLNSADNFMVRSWGAPPSFPFRGVGEVITMSH